MDPSDKLVSPFMPLFLLLMGLCVLMAGRLVYGERDAARDFSHFLLRMAGWFLVVVGTLGSLLVATGFFGVALAIMMSGIIVTGFARLAQAGRCSLMTLMAVTMERRVPLASTILAFGEEWGGRFGRRVTRFAAALGRGQSLDQTAKGNPKVLSTSGRLALSVGQPLADLPAALRMAAEADQQRRSSLDPILGRFLYLTWLLCALAGAVTFIMIKIVPVLEKIFHDFNIPLPPPTKLLIVASYLMMQYGPLLFLFALLVGAVNLCLTAAYLGWRVPRPKLVDRLFSRWHLAGALRPMSLMVERRVPLDLALAAVAEGTASPWARRQLSRAAVDVVAGQDGVEAICRHLRAPKADRTLLQSAERVGNLPWAMRELAALHESRTLVLVSVWSRGLFLVMLLGMSLLVAFVVISSFLPMAQIIERLSQ